MVDIKLYHFFTIVNSTENNGSNDGPNWGENTALLKAIYDYRIACERIIKNLK